MTRKCYICKKDAPDIFGDIWNTEKWLAIMAQANIVAVFCPKHEKECDQFFIDRCQGRSMKEVKGKV